MTARSVPFKTRRIANIKVSLQSITDRITLLDYKSIDNEARARRNNLLIEWLPENAAQTQLLVFLQKELGIEYHIPTDRAHRFG